MPDVDGGPTIFDVTSDIELFKAGTANRGWVVRPSTSGTGDGWTMKSSEYTTDPTLRPALEMVYSLPLTPYAAWALAKSLTAANNSPTADAEHDGANNLAEFAYNLNPLLADAVPITPAGTNGLPAAHYLPNVADSVLEVEFPRRKGVNAVGLTYAVQFSGDLATWSAGLAPTVTSLNADWDRVCVRDAATGANAHRFARVLVTLQP